MKAEIEATIREMLAEVKEGLDYNNMSTDREFGEAGLDSLDVASLLLAVQEHYDVTIDDDKVDELDTLAKLIDYIAANKAA